MKKLSGKSIIEFRGKTEKGKKTFVANLKQNVEKASTEGGGDYWVTSLSAISNYCKSNDLKIIRNKIGELEEKLGNTRVRNTKTMYQRNIDILSPRSA